MFDPDETAFKPYDKWIAEEYDTYLDNFRAKDEDDLAMSLEEFDKTLGEVLMQIREDEKIWDEIQRNERGA